MYGALRPVCSLCMAESDRLPEVMLQSGFASIFMDFLAGLNPQQQEAVRHADGPLLILAGAGSGKTRVVTHRIGYLIRERSVPPERILAVTFTNKAAGEMRDRVGSLIGGLDAARGLILSTFHSFCVRLLRRDGEPLAQYRPGFTRNFLIYDDDDQLALLKSLYKQAGYDDKSLAPRQVLSRISHAKNRGDTPEDLQKEAHDPNAKRIAHLYEIYEQGLRAANALDFDDLLGETVRLLRLDDATRRRWNDRLAYLMVDEYQDTNRVQYDLMRLLSQGHRNVCVVGDEDQSIYSWRGADIQNILDFELDYPGATIIRLEQNYRSTGNILKAAGAVIANNTQRKGKNLWTESPSGAKIAVYEASDSENEALYIADTADRLLKATPGERVAVLYRTNSQSRQIEEALRRYRRPYVVVGGFSFYQRAEVKDVLAYLKLIINPDDNVSLLRVINTPARGIGRSTVEQIEKHAAAGRLSLWNALREMLDSGMLPARAQAALGAFRKTIEDLTERSRTAFLPDLLKHLLEVTGYRRMLETEKTPENEARLENLSELINAAAEASERLEGVAEFLDHSALVASTDTTDLNAPVALLTVHNAKGLEFPVVFLAGMEEGLFPHSRSKDSPSMLEEERRLCYVGMTRAQRQLTLSWARLRRRFGGGPYEPGVRSRFLLELPRQVVERSGVAYEDPMDEGDVDLFVERHEVRETVRRNLYTGKTYNSLDNISEFFRERGIKPPAGRPGGGKVVSMPSPASRPQTASALGPAARPAPPNHPRTPAGPPRAKKAFGAGSSIDHPKYGRGKVLRREGDGDDAKLTVLFPAHGLKKILEKYAGLKIEE